MFTPTASITLGNLKYQSHASHVSISLGLLPDVNYTQISFPNHVDITASAGDTGLIEIMGEDELVAVLDGTISTIRKGLTSSQVVLTDASHVLALTRLASTSQDSTASEIIQNLANEAEIDTQIVDAELAFASYVISQDRTVLEIISTLSELCGCIALVNEKNELIVTKRPSGQADFALMYGREFTQYEVYEAQPPVSKVSLVGNGPAGSTAEPGALRHTLATLPANLGAASKANRRVSSGVLRTPTVAASASMSLNSSRIAQTSQLRANCFLLPHLRPGHVIQVQEMPSGIHSGPWLLTQVSHSFAGGLASTRITAELAQIDALSFASFASGAIGSLGAVGGLI